MPMPVSPGLNSARGSSAAPPLPMTQQCCAGAGLSCVLTAFGGSEGTTGALVLCQIMHPEHLQRGREVTGRYSGSDGDSFCNLLPVLPLSTLPHTKTRIGGSTAEMCHLLRLQGLEI